MRPFNLLLWVALSLPAPALPRHSKIIVLGPFSSVPASDPEGALCQEPVTATQVRARFQRFHEVSFGDIHDEYSYLPCGYTGLLEVDGRRFRWWSYVGEVMRTTYPDGKDHLLAGAPDSPNGNQ